MRMQLMRGLLFTLALTLVLVLLFKYARAVANAYRRGRSLYGLGRYSRSMANRRLWGTVLIGVAAVLVWAYLLLESSLLTEPPSPLWQMNYVSIPFLLRIIVFRRLVAVSVITFLLGVVVVWLVVLAFSDFVEIIRRYRKKISSYKRGKRSTGGNGETRNGDGNRRS